MKKSRLLLRSMRKKFSDFRDCSKSSARLPKNIAPAENRKSAPPKIFFRPRPYSCYQIDDCCSLGDEKRSSPRWKSRKLCVTKCWTPQATARSITWSSEASGKIGLHIKKPFATGLRHKNRQITSHAPLLIPELPTQAIARNQFQVFQINKAIELLKSEIDPLAT